MAKYEPKLMQKKSFIRSKENVIATYQWTEIETGVGYVDYYLSNTEDANKKDYLLTTSSIGTMNTALSTAGSYSYYSNAFSTAREISEGKAYISGETSGAAAIAAKLRVINDENISEGSMSYEQTTPGSTGSYSWQLISTCTINDYIYSAEISYNNNENIDGDLFRYDIVYSDGTTNSSVTDVGLPRPTEPRVVTITNPYPSKLVTSVRVDAKANGGSGSSTSTCTYIKAYEQDGLEIKEVASSVTGVSKTDTAYLLILDCSQTSISIGDKLLLEVTKSGGGSFATDPIPIKASTLPLRVSCPFKINN